MFGAWGRKNTGATNNVAPSIDDNDHDNNDRRSDSSDVPSDLRYQTVRQAVTNEKELMKFMVELGEDRFKQLMGASDAYIKALQSSQKHQAEMAAVEERKARLDHQKNLQDHEAIKRQQEGEQKLEQMRVRGEELRQNERVKTEEAKRRIDYEQEKMTQEEIKREKLRLETRREFERMDSDRKREEEAQEQRRFERERDMLRTELAEKARLKRETEVELGQFRIEQAIKEHNAKKDDELVKAKELKKLEVEADIQKESVRWEKLSNFFSGEEGKARMWNVGGLVAGSLGALYFFKTVQPLAERGLRNYFFKPTLVSRTTYHNGYVGGLIHRASSVFNKPKPMPDVILEPHLQDKMNTVIEGTRTASKRGGYFGGMMLYGRPGTGKTLFAEKLARESGMDFAVMSGPSFEQFTAQEAIVEIKNLFKWANKSNRGMLLFVDEADSFLEDRSTLNPQRVSVLNEWLNQTGTESRKFMCIYETNRPEVLDPAVQSRIARSIEMPPPGEREICRMLEQYIDLYVISEHKALQAQGEAELKDTDKGKEKEIKFVGETPIEIEREKRLARFGLDLRAQARKLSAEGFVGRDVSNLCISIAQALYARSTLENTGLVLSEDLVERVVNEQIAKKKLENAYIASRKARIQAMGKFDSLHL